MGLSAGTHLGPYEILSQLGAGGMGEVYKARDTRLQRDVAIKILPAAFAADPDRLHRFQQEARAIAILNHPHICHLYDIGPDYLVMEYIEGQQLCCPLPPDDALRLSMQIGAALQEAHSKHILHRDLKPANIMVSANGEAKLLDFGLAKFENAEVDVTQWTLGGTLVGTTAYMSPEQAEGRELDSRSDIFSFGAVLYELFSGRRAFPGETTAQVLSSILRDDPPPLPFMAVDAVVKRCLSKNPGERFQIMADLLAALQQATMQPAAEPRILSPVQRLSIAVLPFANLSADPDNEYFSDGLAEEIINALIRVPGLKVIGRTSAFAFKSKNENVGRIAQALGVAYVLEGSVRRAGNRVRVMAQLLSTSDGSHTWSERYDRQLTDIFAIQDDIAQSIVAELCLKIDPGSKQLLPNRHAANLEAHHLFLKGRFYAGKRAAPALQKAIQYFRDAIELDPLYAPAYAGLAECYVPLAFYGHLRPSEAWPKVRAASLQALEIDPTLAEAQTALERARTLIEWDLFGTEQEFRTTIQHAPDYGRARQCLAENLVATGRFDEAAAQIERALESDPLALAMNAAVGLIGYFGRSYDLAIEQLLKTIEMDAHFYPAHWYLGLVYEQKREFASAVSELREAAELSDNGPIIVASLAAVLAAAGESEQARHLLEELRQVSASKYVPQLFTAVVLSRLGDRGAALDCLEQAYVDRCPWLLFAMVDPKLDQLRREPRFDTLVRRMGLSPTVESPIIRPS